MSSAAAIEQVYTPSAWGREYHSLTIWEGLGAGSAGPGKTTVLGWEFLDQMTTEHKRCLGEHEHAIKWGESRAQILFLRRELGGLEDVIKNFYPKYKKIDPGAKYYETDKMWVFSSGLRFKYGHCQNSGDWIKYIGDEYTMVLFDELVTFEREQYDNITTRCRTSDPVLIHMLKIRAMSNPFFRRDGNAAHVKDVHWVRRRFVDPAPEGRVLLQEDYTNPFDGTKITKERVYLPAKLTDNPDKQFVRIFIQNLVDKPAHIRKALIEGEWYITADSFFGEHWKSSMHVCAPRRVPLDWRFFRSMDWGFKTHGCIHWWAMDDESTLWCIEEFSFRNMLAKDVAVRAREIEQRLGLWGRGSSRIIGWADTQLWEERGDTGLTKAAEFAQKGLPWVPANKKSRARNAEFLTARLTSHENGASVPGIVFFDRCKMAIRTIPSILPDPDLPEEPMKGGDDHWADSVYYAVSAASHGLTGLPPMTSVSTGYDDDEEVTKTDRGRYGYGQKY